MNQEELELLLKNLPADISQGNFGRKELETCLVTLRQAVLDQELSHHKFISVILEALSKNPPQTLTDLLQVVLMEASTIALDERIIYYWQGLSNSQDQFQKDNAISELFRLSTESQLAYEFLRTYLRQEPSQEIARLLFSLMRRERHESLENSLSTLQRQLFPQELLQLILDKLNQNPSKGEQNVLLTCLEVYKKFDKELVARYWGSFLASGNETQREWSLVELYLLKAPLAHQILREYLGQEPTWGIVYEKLLSLLDKTIGSK